MTPHNLTECVKCGSTLGNESRENGWHVCHNCRICDQCNKKLRQPDEVEIFSADNVICRHTECDILKAYQENGAALQESYQPTQRDLDKLNKVILINPNMGISLATDIQSHELSASKNFEFMSYEEIQRAVRIQEAVAAFGRNFIRKNSNKTSEQLDKEQATRESKKFTKHQEQLKSELSRQENSRSEKIKNLKGLELSNHVREKNYHKFIEKRNIKDEKDSRAQFKAFVNSMKLLHLVKTIEDADRVEFTDAAFDKAFAIMGL